jgi:hypothetical protein
VLDDDIVHDNFLGTAVVPFTYLREGYRHIALTARDGNIVPGSTLFVKVNKA